ncbi:hypothetical protein ACQPX6_07040 [Actinomycetospora sp. CA-101289]|uniref:hypothetical protein n=1 Tax=Actinomycetospora sp. CA-101289 TaxID=3239893 RepID=UPI003D96CE00
MGTLRNPSSRVIGVHGLPTPVISLIQEQAEVRGLFRDPLPEVTHGLRTDVVSVGSRWFGRSRPRRHAVELLLTPDVLVVCDRDPDSDGMDPDTQVTFHRLQQVEVTAGDADGAPGLSLLSTPVGSTERSCRVVSTDGGPESARFFEALTDAAERSRTAAETPVPRMPVDSRSPEYT